MLDSPCERGWIYRGRGPVDAALVAPPPFSFPGVTARVFPLRADMSTLRIFCKSSLNVAPEVCEFHPYLPLVLLVILDYGRMADEVINLGWVSQHEFFFAVPLGKWVRSRKGKPLVFREWVLNTPYIFVDDPSSLSAGREIYGWSKVLVKPRPSLEKWLSDPRKPTRLLTLNIKGFGSDETRGERLLAIDQKLGQNPSLSPPDFEMVDPFRRLSRVTRTSWETVWDLAQALVRPPLAGFSPKDPGGRGMVLLDSLRQLFHFSRKPRVEALTFKQFPDVGDPSLACYQALVQSRMGVARFNRGGLLGLYNLLQGDITGGFRIHLHEHPSFPIVASLGLEVAKERTVDKRAVSILEPFFPFWMSVDLVYGKGKELCSRIHNSPWIRNGAPVSGRSKPARYNTFAGAAQQVQAGPVLIPSLRLDVFPLPADPGKLGHFIGHYLNGVRQQLRFEPWGNHVYMVASSGRSFSYARSGAPIESRLISFNVPLIWYEGNEPRGFVVSRPFVFVDNPTLVTSMREVQGVPATTATIRTPKDSWLTGGPVLQIKTDIFAALNAGLSSKRRTLIEVMKMKGVDSVSSSGSPPRDGSCLDPCLDLARQILCGQKELVMLSLKQFPSVEEPRCACYQSFVTQPRTLCSPRIARLDGRHPIRFYRYPSFPLVDLLGLRVSSIPAPPAKGRAVAEIVEPENPFRVELMDLEIGFKIMLPFAAGDPSRAPVHPGPAVDAQAPSLSTEQAASIWSCNPQNVVEEILARLGPDGDPCAPSPT